MCFITVCHIIYLPHLFAVHTKAAIRLSQGKKCFLRVIIQYICFGALFICLFVAFFVSALICMCVCGIPVGLQASITLYKFHQHIHNNSRWGSLPFTSKMYFCVYLIVSKAVISTRHSWRSENPNDHIY